MGKTEIKPTIVTNPEVKETIYVKETDLNPALHQDKNLMMSSDK